MRKPLPRHPASRGFTIIEILIVLVLIGVVLGIVANRLAGGAVRGQVNAAKIAINSLGGKIEGYTLENGTAPQSLQDLVTKPGDAAAWSGPYVKESELKDPWGREFTYASPGTDKEFDLCSLGPDGKAGGEGIKAADICNQ